MFMDHGYAAASMSRIAIRSGCSKATLYDYFPSKGHLFAAAMAARCKQMSSQIRALDGSGATFRECLYRLGENATALFFSDDWIATLRLVIAESGRFPELGRILLDPGAANGTKRVAEFLSHGIAQGALKPGDTNEMASTYIDLIESDRHARRLWNVEPEPSLETIACYAARATDLFLAIYGSTDSR
jgi:TetR/AcrR family transcriptional repressor of mexJK operon